MLKLVGDNVVVMERKEGTEKEQKKSRSLRRWCFAVVIVLVFVGVESKK